MPIRLPGDSECGAEMRLALCAPASVRTELEQVLRELLDYSVPEVGFTLRTLPIEWVNPEIHRVRSKRSGDSCAIPTTRLCSRAVCPLAVTSYPATRISRGCIGAGQASGNHPS